MAPLEDIESKDEIEMHSRKLLGLCILWEACQYVKGNKGFRTDFIAFSVKGGNFEEEYTPLLACLN